MESTSSERNDLLVEEEEMNNLYRKLRGLVRMRPLSQFNQIIRVIIIGLTIIIGGFTFETGSAQAAEKPNMSNIAVFYSSANDSRDLSAIDPLTLNLPTSTFTPPIPPTPTSTNTPILPTSTYTPTNTPTPILPTPTYTPTNTPTPILPTSTNTPTPIPPTPTFTSTPTPISPEEQIDHLIDDVEALGFLDNSEKQLLKKLNDALDKLDDLKPDSAIQKLYGFIAKVNRSVTRGEIDQATADSLIADTQAIIDAINAL